MNDAPTPTEHDTGHEVAERSEACDPEAEATVPVPAHDEATVELVRDAIGVARGEISDECFAEKYDTVG